MGFLSSLFDFGDKPTTTSGGQTMTPVIPEMLKPNVQEVVDASQSLYKQRLGEGYKPYTGQTIAGFSPEEVAAQEGLKSLVGTQAPLQQEAINMARGQAREFTPETAQQYMSPYLRTALDAQKAQAQRQYESVKQPQFEADAVAAGGMSGLGSRAAVQAAEMDSNQQRMLADIEAVGQQKAFEAAEQSFRDQTSRERTAGQDLLKGSADAFAGGVKEQGLLTAIGEQKRDLSQSALDEAYLKYVTEQQFPEQQLARYQSSIYGNPLLAQPSYSKTTTGSQAGGGPGLGKTLLGIGSTAASIAAIPGISDERAKTDITPIGMDDSTGLQMFAYRYKGDPKSYPKVVGPIAQDVEKKYPEAVGEVNGFKTVSMDMLQNNGIAGTPEGQEYIERSAAMGGPVMPPVMYRQENGKVMPPTLSIQEKINEIDRLERAKQDSYKRLSGREKFGPLKGAPLPVTEEIVTPGGVRIPVNPQDNLPLDDEFSDEGGYYSGLTTLSDGTGQSTPDTTQADIDKFLQAQGNKQGLTALEATDQEDAGKVIIGYKNGEPIFGPPPVPTKDKDTLPSASEASQITVDAERDAANVAIETALSVRNIDKETSNSIRGELSAFSDKYKKLAANDPYKMAKFLATIAANIMKPGNAFANMAQGVSIAINDLDATRKEKDKLLMELEDTMAKVRVKLIESEGKSKIDYTKFTGKQRAEIAKLGKVGLDAFNAQLKVNGDYIAALAAAKKAENAARVLDAKERKEGQLTIADQRRLTEVVTERLSDIAGGYFRKGASIGVKATKYKRDLDNAFQDMYVREGKKAADDFLAFTLKEDMPKFPEMFSKKAKK